MTDSQIRTHAAVGLPHLHPPSLPAPVGFDSTFSSNHSAAPHTNPAVQATTTNDKSQVDSISGGEDMAFFCLANSFVNFFHCRDNSVSFGSAESVCPHACCPSPITVRSQWPRASDSTPDRLFAIPSQSRKVTNLLSRPGGISVSCHDRRPNEQKGIAIRFNQHELPVAFPSRPGPSQKNLKISFLFQRTDLEAAPVVKVCAHRIMYQTPLSFGSEG